MKIFFAIAIILAGSAAMSQTLTGTWKQDCQVIDDDIQQMQLQISSSELVWRGTGFEAEGCQTPYLYYDETYSIQKISSLNDEEFSVDLQTAKVTYTPLSDEIAEALNLVAFCDVQSWKANSSTDVTGKVCQDRAIRAKDAVYFQRIGLKNSELQWGDTTGASDGSSADRRPVSYEPISFKR